MQQKLEFSLKKKKINQTYKKKKNYDIFVEIKNTCRNIYILKQIILEVIVTFYKLHFIT